MKVLFLAAGVNTPASRFRVQQFFPALSERGIDCHLRVGYGEGYTVHAARWYAPGYKGISRLRRALSLADVASYDVVFHQRSALLYSSFPEFLASRVNPNVVVDFDDAIFLRPDGKYSRMLEHSFGTLMASAKRVIAGNAYLAQHTGRPDVTTVIPTVIDTDEYTPLPHRGKEASVVIGWMGSASNLHELQAVAPAIRAILLSRPNVVLRVVSNGTTDLFDGIPRVECIPWSKEAEKSLLRSFDIGIMPLTDSAWTRGKCGFKLIQYMATGKPVVAAAVGANVDIVGESDAGLLVGSEGDWYDALSKYVDSRELRDSAGAAARERAVKCFSVGSVVDAYHGMVVGAAS